MVILYSMKLPIFVRPFSDAERETPQAALCPQPMPSPCAAARSCSLATGAKTPTRSLTSSAAIHKRHATPSTLSNQKGLPEALQAGSKHQHTLERAFDSEQAEALRELVHQNPRKFGEHSSLRTLEMAALVSFEEGLTKKSGSRARPSGLLFFARLGVRWERAKRWITSPDPEYATKKAARPIDEDGGQPSRLLGSGFL
jgi:hypothetical protein